MKLGLGTAQFGLDYGIANRGGRTSREDARAVLARAAAAGVRWLDTAPAYGQAESLLGELAEEVASFAIGTKTPAELASSPRGAAREALLGSLDRLRRESVAALLVHDRADLLGPQCERIFEELAALRAEGLAERIGASVYHPEEADDLLERFPLDVLQIPLNVFDQRALRGGHLGQWKARGVEVHARSVFLQGLLLLDPHEVPAVLGTARQPLQAFHDRARSLGLSGLEAALGFVVALGQVDLVICGVDRPAHLEQLLAALRATIPPGALEDLAIEDRVILDPSSWPVFR